MQKLVLISRTAEQRKNLLRLVKLFSGVNECQSNKILINFSFSQDCLTIYSDIIQPIEDGYNLVFFSGSQLYIVTINSTQYNLVADYYPLINVEECYTWAEKNTLGIDC